MTDIITKEETILLKEIYSLKIYEKDNSQINTITYIQLQLYSDKHLRLCRIDSIGNNTYYHQVVVVHCTTLLLFY